MRDRPLAAVTRIVGLGLVGALLAASCSGTEFPRAAVPHDAPTSLRDAARFMEAGRADLTGTLDGHAGPIVRLTGYVDFQARTLSVTTSSATNARYAPFEGRFVDETQYIQVGPTVKRPRALRPGVTWVSLIGPSGDLPIPDRTMPPAYPFQLADLLRSGAFAGATFVGPTTADASHIQFRVPSFETPSDRETLTATIDSRGRIVEVSTVARFAINGTPREQQDSDLKFEWTDRVPTVVAPPAADVQRLAPGSSLYPTTTTPPVTIGPVSSADAVAGNRALFNGDRAQLETTFRATPDPKFVSLTYDEHANEIRIAFAYADPSQVSRTRADAFAWQTGQTVAGSFWFPELMQGVLAQHGNATWLPKLQIVLGTVAYECPSRTEIAMAGAGLSLKDWLAQCRT